MRLQFAIASGLTLGLALLVAGPAFADDVRQRNQGRQREEMRQRREAATPEQREQRHEWRRERRQSATPEERERMRERMQRRAP